MMLALVRMERKARSSLEVAVRTVLMLVRKKALKHRCLAAR